MGKISDLNTLTVAATTDLLAVAREDNETFKYPISSLYGKLPSGTKSAPALAFNNDQDTGIYQLTGETGSVMFAINGSYLARFSPNGLLVGGGEQTDVADAQLHLMSASTNDQLIIENSEASATASPNIVLHRNKADVNNVADGDSLGQIIFRGDDDGNNATPYANILCVAKDVSNAAEKGSLEFKTIESAASATRMSIVGSKVGINTTDPQQKLHVADTTVTNQARLECNNADTSTVGGGLELYRHTNGNGGANHKLSTIEFNGNDSAGNESTFGRVSSAILTATSGSEGGQVSIDVATSTQSGQLDAKLIVNENRVQALSTLNIPTGTPSSSSAAGTAGDIVWDSSFLYVCVQTQSGGVANTWKRVALSTF